MMTKEEISRASVEWEDFCIALRRDFHRHPELSGQEVRTIARICEELRQAGLSPIEVENGGVLAVVEGNAPGKTVLLRADVDALPVQEDPCNLLKEKNCVSQVPGVGHVCGHDCHAAMLVTAGKILAKHRDFPGRIILMFERGEEGGGNIRYLIDYLQKNQWNIDGIWGLHLNNEIPTGKFAIRSGTLMAGGLMFDITLVGKDGHGSRPDWSNNPVDCFHTIQTALDKIRMRMVDPSSALTFSICKVVTESQRPNIIGRTLNFAGNVRFFDLEHAYRPFSKAMRRMIDHIAAAFECQVLYNQFDCIAVPLVNNQDCYHIAERALTEQFGPERVIPGPLKFGSESFSYLMNFWPGMYLNLGVYDPALGTGAGHHTAKFDVDESQLKTGVAVHIAYAQAFLNNPNEITGFTSYPGTIWDLLNE